ncbi:hypothetical protein [Pantoea phytobeneficialis]|uniref:Uncharacterized protein n=1 Tax=Pantoea phytobeneficialis TaxID=2052056 RepID=A0ABT8XSX3_9GAMM|nr:hypothetical protein [Pantoea phytobeneficialis]MDO6406557.1 hypothetical protein [Pantoea phytobeneficialis]
MLNIQSHPVGRYLTICSASTKQHVNAPEHLSTSQEIAESGFHCELPFRYIGLPVRRKLTRMMLMMKKSESRALQHSGNPSSYRHAVDYVRGVMDAAMLRGELRYRPTEEVVRFYLSQLNELSILLAGSCWTNFELRCEVRRRTEVFIEKYAAVSRG